MSVILSFICSAASAMAARAAVFMVRSQSVEWKCVEESTNLWCCLCPGDPLASASGSLNN